MNLGSGKMALEYQRYGRNKDTLVNKAYLNGGEYRRKFDNATENPLVNKTLYNCAKEALIHRSGTWSEDMYWIDGDNGKLLFSVLDSVDEQAIVYTEKIRANIKANSNIVTLQTHPNSMPPSASDFNSSYYNDYRECFVACHDGKVYRYTADESINERIYDMYIQKYIKNGLSEFEAQLKTLERLSGLLNIEFCEVTSNG